MKDSCKKMCRPLWVEIDLSALRHNFTLVRKSLSPDVKVIATVKQSAYGHGLIPVVKELSFMGVDAFGVGSIEEGIALRDAGIKEPILILSVCLSEFSDCFIKYNLTPAVVDLKFAKKLSEESIKKKKVSAIHVKIDTGMGRLGVYYKNAGKLIRQLSKLKNISLEGIFTHFPLADSNVKFTNNQISVFNKFILDLKNEGITFKYYHCANSLGILNYPNSHFNMVRPGIILYGIKSKSDIKLKVKPVLSLKSKVIFVKKVEKGMGIGYGRTYVSKKPTFIATVSIGYADGYPWILSNVGKVIIKDRIFKIAGRVCMDHVMVDLGDRSDIKPGDEVILIGHKKDLKITSEDIATWAKTIPYEIVSRLSLKIPRVYKGSSF